MSAKELNLDAVRAMPDGATKQEILNRLAAIVVRPGDDSDAEPRQSDSYAEVDERYARKLHPTTATDKLALEAELNALAADPDIQREMRRIEQEFACTDWDGMEGY
jgi:hypothetical protein